MKVLKSMALIFAMSFLFNYTSNAQIKWNWSKGASGAGEEAGSTIATDNSGNVYVAGYFYGGSFKFGTNNLVNLSPLSTDIFLAKYSATGDLVWVKSFGGEGNELVTDIDVDATGNIYITGTFTSDIFDLGNGNQLNNSSVWIDIYIAKLNSSGTVIWAKSAGGKDFDYSTGLAVDATGNVYLTGYYSSDTLTFNKSPLEQIITPAGFTFDVFLAKYNSSGAFQWVKNAGNEGDDEALGVAVDNSGNPIITGYFMSTAITFGTMLRTNENMNQDMFLVKYDPSGTATWAKVITGFWNETGNALTTDASGNIYVCGEYSSDNVEIGSVTLTNSNPGQASEDIYAAKFNSAGTALWAKTAEGLNAEYAKDISVDATGNVYVTGSFGSPTMKVGTYVLNNSVSTGSGEIYVIKYNSTGGVLAAISAQSTGDDDSRGIAAYGKNAYITGTYKANPKITFGNYPLVNTGNYDILIASVGEGLSIKDEEFDKHFSIYPNPVTDKFTLSVVDNSSGKYNYKIYDITGKLFSESNIDLRNNNSYQVSVPAGKKGLLLIRLTSENGQTFSRSVICN
jgi:hypothetical protein